MIISKQALELYLVAQADRGIPVLDNIHVTEDGATIAANSKSVVIAGPITETIREGLPLADDGNRVGAITIPIGLCKEVVNAIPNDTQFAGLTEHALIQDVDGKELEFTITDGRRKKSLYGKRFDRAYINFKTFLYKIFSSKRYKARLVLNRKRLLNLLMMLERTCSDKTGASPIFLEISESDEIILRCVNPRTGQHFAAYMSSYSADEESWIENDMWEQQWVKEIAKVKR